METLDIGDDENSIAPNSPEFILSTDGCDDDADEADDSFKPDNNDVVAYRVLEFSDCVDPQKSLLNNGTTGTLDISAGGQQYFVISSDSNLANAGGTVYVNASNGAILTASSTTILPPPPPSSHPPNKLASAGILIAPKPIGLDASSPPTTTTGRQQAPLMKRRDDRRRTTHNEVERRRRDKINTGIMQLGSIIPADGVPVASDCSTIMDRPNVANAVGQSKSGILTKACEYIEALHNEVNKLTKSLKDRESASANMQRLKEQNIKLRADNQRLHMTLQKQKMVVAETLNSCIQLEVDLAERNK